MKIETLLDEATARPWLIEPDDRPGMDWNNHIVQQNGNAVCFMAHSGKPDNQQHAAAAELLCNLANSGEELVALVKAARRLCGWELCDAASPDFNKDADAFREALAALEKHADWREGK
jgi:hypothetical protein